MAHQIEKNAAAVNPTRAALAETTRIAFSPSEAARLIGVGRTFLYDALGDGSLKSIKIGARRLITRDALIAWLERHAAPLNPNI